MYGHKHTPLHSSRKLICTHETRTQTLRHIQLNRLRHTANVRQGSLARDTGSGSSGGGQPPRSFGGAGGPRGDDENDQPAASWQPDFGTALALCATSYMLLALLQPWRLLSSLPLIDTSSQAVSIIIPVLNEAGTIVSTLQQLRQLKPAAAELVVVDGGSTDGTLKLVRHSGLADKVIRSGRGRAVQMNAGAQAAKGDLLCFLHADTQPPTDLVAVMRRELRDPHTVLAGFVPLIEGPKGRLWVMSIHNFISTYYAPLLFRPLSFARGLRNLFGDQTLFCRACDFKSVGGFDARWPIMEDTDLCVRLHHAGPCRHSSAAPAPAPAIATAPASRGAQQVAGNPQKQRQQQQQDEHRWQSMQQQWQQWLQPRGRIRQVLDRVSVTSSRRVEAWGPLKATYIHFTIGLSWYFKQDPTLIRQLYDKLYTDAFR